MKKIYFDDFFKEQMKDPEIKKEYDRLKPEYALISAAIEARAEKNLTQKQLAEAVGTDQARISRLERGTLNPSLNFLKKFADGIGKELQISFVPKKA